MDPATAALALKAIDILLAGVSFLGKLNVNYQEVIDAQKAAEAEGRELNQAERQVFIDQAQARVDVL